MPDSKPQSGNRVDMPVGGSGATSANIETVAQALRKCGYCAGHLQGMRDIQIVQVDGRQSILGTWSGGRITLYAQSARSEAIFDHTICHEFAHHLTMAADPEFARSLLAASGTGDSSHPTDYSFAKAPEHLAELVTYYRLGDASEMRWRKAFVPSDEAARLVDEEFGCSTDTTIAVNYPGAPTAGPVDPSSTSDPNAGGG